MAIDLENSDAEFGADVPPEDPGVPLLKVKQVVEVSQSKGPVGSGNYVVQAGDCISSIAYQFGFFWETLWKHENNAEIRSARKDPNILLPGDSVFIPERRKKCTSGATDQRHIFKLKGIPARLRVRFFEEDEPRASEAYVLDIDGALQNGTLDGHGGLDVPIPPNAGLARIRIGGDLDLIELPLGGVDPITEISGVQIRLSNLGFHPGPIDGLMGARTAAAIREFQFLNELEVTGKPDQITRDKLVERHGS